jgi:hypothetical protein
MPKEDVQETEKTLEQEAEELDFPSGAEGTGAFETNNPDDDAKELRNTVDALANFTNTLMFDVMHGMYDYIHKDDFVAGRRVRVQLTRLKMDTTKVLNALEKYEKLAAEKRKARKARK